MASAEIDPIPRPPNAKVIAFAVSVVRSKPPDLSVGGKCSHAPTQVTVADDSQSTSDYSDCISPREAEPVPSAQPTIIWTARHIGVLSPSA